MDEERHEAFTGVHNRWILENIEWAGCEFRREEPGARLTVRIPFFKRIFSQVPPRVGSTASLRGKPPDALN